MGLLIPVLLSSRIQGRLRLCAFTALPLGRSCLGGEQLPHEPALAFSCPALASWCQLHGLAGATPPVGGVGVGRGSTLASCLTLHFPPRALTSGCSTNRSRGPWAAPILEVSSWTRVSSESKNVLLSMGYLLSPGGELLSLPTLGRLGDWRGRVGPFQGSAEALPLAFPLQSGRLRCPPVPAPAKVWGPGLAMGS